MSSKELSDEKFEKRCTRGMILRYQRRERKVFVIAPIGLFKIWEVTSFSSSMDYIRSLRILTVKSSQLSAIAILQISEISVRCILEEDCFVDQILVSLSILYSVISSTITRYYNHANHSKGTVNKITF